MKISNPNKNSDVKVLFEALKAKGVISDADIEAEKTKLKGKKKKK